MRPEEVAYVSFTGKASEVLRKKGNPNATTIHKLIYNSRRLKSGKFAYTKKISLDPALKLIVLDECSMCPANMWEILLSYHVYVIALGDPFQIPPIDKSQNNHLLDSPHVFLDEVMRQAAESDIIQLTMAIRNNKRISPHKGKDANVVRANELVDGMYMWADQILCATNRTRNDINNYMRAVQGFGSEPQVGDKVMCLHNSWDTCSLINEDPLINGSICWISGIDEDLITYYEQGNKEIEVPIYRLTLKTDANDFYDDVIVDKQTLIDGKKFLTPQQEYYICKNRENFYPLPLEFNYGYACTVHRAQGSSWPKVLVIEERFPFDEEEHQQHLYTACTRPEDKLTLVLKN